jgi:hypothetical protein
MFLIKGLVFASFSHKMVHKLKILHQFWLTFDCYWQYGSEKLKIPHKIGHLCELQSFDNDLTYVITASLIMNFS